MIDLETVKGVLSALLMAIVLYAGKPAWFRGEFPKHRSEADYRKDYQASSRFEPIEQR